jgi:hypothetical protein
MKNRAVSGNERSVFMAILFWPKPESSLAIASISTWRFVIWRSCRSWCFVGWPLPAFTMTDAWGTTMRFGFGPGSDIRFTEGHPGYAAFLQSIELMEKLADVSDRRWNVKRGDRYLAPTKNFPRPHGSPNAALI